MSNKVGAPPRAMGGGARDRSGLRAATTGNAGRRDGSRGPAAAQQRLANAAAGAKQGAGGYVGAPATQTSGPQAISTNMVNCLKEELLQTWESYLIPDYHRTVFLDCIYGLTPVQYCPLIVKEIEDL